MVMAMDSHLANPVQFSVTAPHRKTMLGRCRFSAAAPCVWNSLPLGLNTNCDSLCGFKTGLKTYCIYSARTITSQRHSAPQITVISLKLWHFINYITYLFTYLHTRPSLCREGHLAVLFCRTFSHFICGHIWSTEHNVHNVKMSLHFKNSAVTAITISWTRNTSREYKLQNLQQEVGGLNDEICCVDYSVIMLFRLFSLVLSNKVSLEMQSGLKGLYHHLNLTYPPRTRPQLATVIWWLTLEKPSLSDAAISNLC